MVEKFIYFDIYGRGEAIRILLNKANVKFEDVRVKKENWPQLKSTTPNGQLPVFETKNGDKLFQSQSILRYLGKLYGFYPEDPAEAYEVDRLVDCYVDIFDFLAKPAFVPPEMFEQTFKEAGEKLTTFLTDLEPICLKGGWIAGKNLSIADFCIGGIYTNGFNNPLIFSKERWDKLLLKFPGFAAYGQRFYAANQAYLSSRPPAPV